MDNFSINRELAIDINFGTAQEPIYQTLTYKYTVSNSCTNGEFKDNGYESLYTYDNLSRNVSWELSWDKDTKITGHSAITCDKTNNEQYTVSMDWYRCKFFGYPNSWNIANHDAYAGSSFEAPPSFIFEPVYAFGGYPFWPYSATGDCNAYATDIVGGFPEYVGGAILTPNLIYMETQKYTSDLRVSYPEPGNIEFKCEAGTPDEYTRYKFPNTQTAQTHTQSVEDHVIIVSNIGLDLDLLTYSATSNAPYSAVCTGYSDSADPADEDALFVTCAYPDTDHTTYYDHRHKVIRNRAKPTSWPLYYAACNTALFDYIEVPKSGVNLCLIGLWQSVGLHENAYMLPMKLAHLHNEFVRIYIQKDGEWREATDSDINGIENWYSAIENFLQQLKFLDINQNYNPKYSMPLTTYTTDCTVDQRSQIFLPTNSADFINNCTVVESSEEIIYNVYMLTPNANTNIQFYARGPNGWNDSDTWYTNCPCAASTFTYDMPPYPIEPAQDVVALVPETGRPNKFPLFSLGSILLPLSDIVTSNTLED